MPSRTLDLKFISHPRFIMRHPIAINHAGKTMKLLRKYENNVINTNEKNVNEMSRAWSPRHCRHTSSTTMEKQNSNIMQHNFKSYELVVYPPSAFKQTERSIALKRVPL